MNTDPNELMTYLAKGLGRAHIVLEQGASEELVETLMLACIKDPTYDAQVEGSRAAYLLELVTLAEATDRLAGALADLLAGNPDDHDVEQRVELAGLLARSGNGTMRDALYRAQEQLIDRWLEERPNVLPSTAPARQIIALDGIRGAIESFAQLGRAAAADGDFWDGDDLLRQARANLDDDAYAAIDSARAADPRVDAYLQAVERQASRERDDRTADSQAPDRWWEATWTEAQKTIERYVRGTDRIGFFTWRWGKHAADDQLALAAQALVELPQSDVELLRPYLCIFGRRPFPLDPVTLIDLIDDPREKVAWFAVNALEQLRGPDVRAAALRMADSGPLRERSLDLLARNWEPGDGAIAVRLLASESDRDAVHSLSTGLRDVIERHLAPDLVPALLLAYERSPCSECRNRFVAALLALDALPAALRVECHWDADDETRELVRLER